MTTRRFASKALRRIYHVHYRNLYLYELARINAESGPLPGSEVTDDV